MLAGLLVAVGLVVGAAFAQIAPAGAGALLHPGRRAAGPSLPVGCVDADVDGRDVRLRGWRCAATAARRGAIVYLHGVADNRAGAAGVAARFAPRGFDVIAYDSRAHGESTGEACTYGYFEKADLARAIDTLPPGPVVLIGASLGAAVALQAAAEDARITAVVAAETFSDLRTVAAERAPWIVKAGSFGRALRLAEQHGHFRVDDVSPLRAAAHVTVPVFLVHGADDHDTPAAHSSRVFAALAGPKHLELVPGAGHSQSMQPAVWDAVERWIDTIVPSL